MKIINRNIIIHTVVVFLACMGYCLLARQMNIVGNTRFIPWFFLAYLFIIFLSGFLLSRKDEYHNYYGFSYHFVTYAIANGFPILLALLGVLPRGIITTMLFVMAVWGVGLLFHLCMYLFTFRKKTIKHYDKEDVFK